MSFDKKVPQKSETMCPLSMLLIDIIGSKYVPVYRGGELVIRDDPISRQVHIKDVCAEQ